MVMRYSVSPRQLLMCHLGSLMKICIKPQAVIRDCDIILIFESIYSFRIGSSSFLSRRQALVTAFWICILCYSNCRHGFKKNPQRINMIKPDLDKDV